MTARRPVWDEDDHKPRVRLLADCHRLMRSGAVLTVFLPKTDALRRANGISLAKAHDLVGRGLAELVGNIPLPPIGETP
jgi:hypothetical protein